MFVYDTEQTAAVNVNRIRALHIDRIEDPMAHTEEEHDKADHFCLRAFVGGRFSVILAEVTGKDNITVLTEKMHQITDSIR